MAGVKKLVLGLAIYVGIGCINQSENSTLEKKIVENSAEISYEKNDNPLNLDAAYKYSFQDLEKFNGWVEYTLKESKENNSNAIIVDKSSYTLYLIQNGEVHSKYPVELGENPYDDKQKEGDECTPEGLYKIVKKKGPGQTDYYKSFLINYPNKEDKEEGKTGGEIAIHGKGLQGYNWTNGCPGTSNRAMDILFKYIGEGDPVTITRFNNRLEKL